MINSPEIDIALSPEIPSELNISLEPIHLYSFTQFLKKSLKFDYALPKSRLQAIQKKQKYEKRDLWRALVKPMFTTRFECA